MPKYGTVSQVHSQLVVAEEISLQSALKRFPSFGPPANGNKSNAKNSRFRPNLTVLV